MTAQEEKRPRSGEEEVPAKTLRERFDEAELKLDKISECTSLADQCATLLAQARLEEAAGRSMAARDLITRLECALTRAKTSWDTVRWWIPAAIGYEMAVVAGLVYVMFRPGLEKPAPFAYQLLPYALWGGLGGAVAALFGLYLHVAKRDFDRGYLPFYFLKPVLGLVLGPVMYLFVRAGLMAAAVTGTAASPGPTAGAADAVPASPPEFLLLAAFTVGFGERFTIRLIDRVASAIFGEAEAPKPEAQRPPAEPAVLPPSGGAAESGDLVLELEGIQQEPASVKLLRDGREVKPAGSEWKQGKLTLSGLAPGEYEVQVQATKEAEWRPTSPAKVEVEAGESTETTVALEGAG